MHRYPLGILGRILLRHTLCIGLNCTSCRQCMEDRHTSWNRVYTLEILAWCRRGRKSSKSVCNSSLPDNTQGHTHSLYSRSALNFLLLALYFRCHCISDLEGSIDNRWNSFCIDSTSSYFLSALDASSHIYIRPYDAAAA